MNGREVVLCNGSDGACENDHHGWGCPLSDPAGDILRVLTEPGAVSENPILDRWRQGQVEKWLTVGSRTVGRPEGRGVREGYTEGYTETEARGARDNGGFRTDKSDLSFGWSEGPIGRRMRAQGFTRGLSCTPREPLVNPSTTPGEPLKPLKEKKASFMRPSAPHAQAQPLTQPGGVHGVHDAVWRVVTAVAVMMLCWSVIGEGLEHGWVRSVGLHAVAAAGIATTIWCFREWRRLGPIVRPEAWVGGPSGSPHGSCHPWQNPSALWSAPRAGEPSTEPIAPRLGDKRGRIAP